MTPSRSKVTIFALDPLYYFVKKDKTESENLIWNVVNVNFYLFPLLKLDKAEYTMYFLRRK